MSEYLPGLEPAPVDNDRERFFCVDRTPLPVVRQILSEIDIGTPSTVLDVGCGEGAWSQVARELWPDAFIVGIEPREEAHPYADKHCDLVAGFTFQEFWHNPDDFPSYPRHYDLIAGNPAFSKKLPSGKKHNLFPELIEFAFEHLNPYGTVCYYALNQLGQRGEATIETFKRYPPSEQLRVMQSIGHRGPKRDDVEGSGTGDSRCYSAWIWHAEDVGDGSTKTGWRARNLEMLDADDRRWITVPGT